MMSPLPLPGWGLEMPYSVACRGGVCSGSVAGDDGALPTLDVVLAAQNQPTAPLVRMVLDTLPLARLAVPTVWIYHKGRHEAQDIAELQAAAAGRAQLQLGLGFPNVGRAEHSCVHHVVQNYARLADMTLFLKDTAVAHAHLGVTLRVFSFARRLLASGVDVWCARPPGTVTTDFALDDYRSEKCWRWAQCYANETYQRARTRPLGAWMARIGVAPRPARVPVCFGGFFAASRAAIRTSAFGLYAQAERDLSRADSLEEGHYMERAWLGAFGQRVGSMAPRFARAAVFAAHCGEADGVTEAEARAAQ